MDPNLPPLGVVPRDRDGLGVLQGLQEKVMLGQAPSYDLGVGRGAQERLQLVEHALEAVGFGEFENERMVSPGVRVMRRWSWSSVLRRRLVHRWLRLKGSGGRSGIPWGTGEVKRRGRATAWADASPGCWPRGEARARHADRK